MPLPVLLLTLCGCAGLPLGHERDPGAAAAVADTTALADECRRHFVAALNGQAVSFVNGPSVERDGDFTRISLEADSANPDAIHPYRYECRFEGRTLGDAALLP